MRGLRPSGASALLMAVFFLCAADWSWGQTSADADKASSGERLVRFRGSVEWISAVRWLAPSDTELNPGNAILRLPQFWAQTELRPNARLEMGSRLTLVARPRVLAVTETSWADEAARLNVRDTSANWTELYANWRPNDILQLTYGLQNFQWGPAELLSPSNRIFHEVGIFRDPLYYVRGRHLARVNVSVGKEWSLVALAELGDNGEPDFNAGQAFRRQAQAKIEYSAASGVGYVGVTAGARQQTRPWLGEYASLALSDGFSVYIDATHTKGSSAWYPVRSSSIGVRFDRRDEQSHTWRTLGVAGVRYTFPNGIDVREELMHQDAGYRDRDMPLAALAAASAGSRVEFEPYLAPGLELLGRKLTLTSVRFPDLPPNRHLVIQARYLRSLTDRSGVVFLTTTCEATDALVLFASATITHGRQAAEFSRLARGSVVGGGLWTW